MKKYIFLHKSIRKTVRELYDDINEFNFALKGEITLIISPFSVTFNDALVKTGNELLDRDYKEEMTEFKYDKI